MKETHTIDREIEVVKHLIDQLEQCLGIFKNAGNCEAYKETLGDIRKCKTELKKLIELKKSNIR